MPDVTEKLGIDLTKTTIEPCVLMGKKYSRRESNQAGDGLPLHAFTCGAGRVVHGFRGQTALFVNRTVNSSGPRSGAAIREGQGASETRPWESLPQHSMPLEESRAQLW